MAQLDYFRMFAPEFASVTDDSVASWLNVATVRGSMACLMGDAADMATALYAAHLVWIAENLASGESGGTIRSEREGDLQRTYGSVKGDDTWLGQSPYGMQYSEMISGCFGGGIMTRFGQNIPQGIAPDGLGVTGFISGVGLWPPT